MEFSVGSSRRVASHRRIGSCVRGRRCKLKRSSPFSTAALPCWRRNFSSLQAWARQMLPGLQRRQIVSPRKRRLGQSVMSTPKDEQGILCERGSRTLQYSNVEESSTTTRHIATCNKERVGHKENSEDSDCRAVAGIASIRSELPDQIPLTLPMPMTSDHDHVVCAHVTQCPTWQDLVNQGRPVFFSTSFFFLDNTSRVLFCSLVMTMQLLAQKTRVQQPGHFSKLPPPGVSANFPGTSCRNYGVSILPYIPAVCGSASIPFAGPRMRGL